ncbi:hypothetical protein DFP72DRAFT_265066 [Ephemerocybe angulata]|uniref:Uncharacterized protein n=1 Tax=Ephemerocybe angulata TaxID=980116 RepID=A0A8H6I1K0_9AGAR|nr:hypothetical protein DFP72DRAFT_265066 [Tulosesus angulatus]
MRGESGVLVLCRCAAPLLCNVSHSMLHTHRLSSTEPCSRYAEVDADSTVSFGVWAHALVFSFSLDGYSLYSFILSFFMRFICNFFRLHPSAMASERMYRARPRPDAPSLNLTILSVD